MFKEDLELELRKALGEDVSLEVPPDSSLGDFALPCFQFSKKLKKSPQDVAKDIIKKIKLSFIEKTEIKGAYLNFFVKKDLLAEKLFDQINKEQNNYGSLNLGKGKKIVIDFSSPNVAKPFSIGHLRSTIIGNSLYKMYSFLGYKVERLNYLGDWGTQFGVMISAYLKWGDKKKLEKEGINYLVSLYIKFHKEEEENPDLHEEAKEWFKKLEGGDKKALELWKLFREISLEEFKKIYKILDVEFDSFDGESSVKDQVNATIDFIKKKDIVEESEGALVVKIEKLPPCMLVKTDETTTYASRDLTAIQSRDKLFSPVKIIYVVGGEQKLHFQQVFQVAKKAGLTSAELIHVDFGFYLGQDGKKLSTRKGKIILMEDVLNETIELALKTIKEKNPELKNKEEVSKMIGVGAVMFGDLANDRIKDIIFDMEKILDFNGDTGPYLQYTHARACSILRKAPKIELKTDLKILKEKVEHDLMVQLSKFNSAITDSVQNHKPHILARYLIELARLFNEFYQKHPVISDDEDLMKSRLLLVHSARQVIFNGLTLLGIKAPMEM